MVVHGHDLVGPKVHHGLVEEVRVRVTVRVRVRVKG